MRYNQDFIEQVRDANNIVDIIGQYTDLKGRGPQYMGLCPFPDHTEKSPSFSVSEPKQLYHCFGCKKSGNLFTFLETYSGLSFTDAVEFLARRANIPLPETTEAGERSSKPTFFRINKYAAAFFHRQLKSLPEDHIVRKYLAQRGLDEATIDEMKLGYASEEWSLLSDLFQEKGVPVKEAERLGLIKPKRAGGYFDLFRHRLMFPIFSPQEDVLGFGGRVFDKDQKPKYLNSPESPIFSKGRTFYGLNIAAKHIRQKDRAVIVEGYMDQIALVQAGIRNVVATLGTALTEDHAKLIKKHTPQVVLMFDGDFAGMQAAERSLIPMFAQGLCPLAVFLPESLDPDDYVKKYGATQLQQQIDEAQELFILILNDWLKDFKFSTHEKLIMVDRLAEFLNAIGEQGLKDLYVKEVAKRLAVEEKWVLRQIKDDEARTQRMKENAAKRAALAAEASSESAGSSHLPPASLRTNPSSPTVAGSNPVGPTNPTPAAPIIAPTASVVLKGSPRDEVFLLGIALNSSELLSKVIESGVVDCFSSKNVQILLAQAISRYRQNPSDFDKLAPLIVSQVKDPEELTGLFRFWSLDGADEESLRAAVSCIKRVKERHLRRQSEIIAGQLQNGSSGESLEKLEQIMNIHKNRIQLNRSIKGEP